MAKGKNKKRRLSVLRTLCLMVVMLAVFTVSYTPVQATVQTFRVPSAKYFDGTYPSTFTEGEPMTLYFDLVCINDSFVESHPVKLLTGNGPNDFILLGDLSGVFDRSGIYTFTCTAPAAGVYDDGFSVASVTANIQITILPPAAPAESADHGTDEYYDRHYNVWLPVLTQLRESGNNATVTVDTTGQDLDMVMHFVFDGLNNTNRTLVIKHQGETYTIRGRTENAGGMMGGILLGHNHSFDILGAYRSK